MSDVLLQAQVALLRKTLKEVLACLHNSDATHIVVDPARSNVGLGQHIRRVLRDTNPRRVELR